MTASRPILAGLAILLAVAMLALAGSACGDGGETPADGETPQADGAEDGNGGGEVALEELSQRIGAAADGVVAKVTYEVTTGLDGETFEGEWVLIQRPPDFRFEFVGTGTGEGLRTIIIDSGGGSYVCTSRASQESCLEVDVSEAETRSAPFSPLFYVPEEVAEHIESISSVGRSQRTIAGVDAACFTVESTLPDLREGEICFSDEGIVLFLRSLGATFEATSVSTDVTDEDFEPPFEIVELPGW